MNMDKQEKEIEILKTVQCGRFTVIVSQIKMTDTEREIENNRIRKQFMMARS